jgi:hypothetical protein
VEKLGVSYRPSALIPHIKSTPKLFKLKRTDDDSSRSNKAGDVGAIPRELPGTSEDTIAGESPGIIFLPQSCAAIRVGGLVVIDAPRCDARKLVLF